MGNGSGLSIDIETLSLDDLEKAAAAAVAYQGRSPIILAPPNWWTTIPVTLWNVNPEYNGTPWADTARMTKRERAVAGLHTTLHKLGALKKITQDEFEDIRTLSIKRLKRAKWAKYQQKKVKSSP